MTDAEQRANRLFADKAIALQDLQRAQANRVAATEGLDVARAEIDRARAELEHYGLADEVDQTKDHDQVPVHSPIAGAVLERLVTEGTAVVPGAPLFVVSDLSRLWVLAEVDEAQLAKLRVGRAVQVRVAAYPSETFTGTIAQIGDAVSHTTRRVTVRCEVPNPDGRLKPEMFANVLLEESEPRRVITVPSVAIQTVRGATGIFVAEGGGKFRLKPVEIGANRGGDVEVRRGVSVGDKVVVGGAFALKSELLASSAAE
jgi:cobalt-zinc-cadmium efflux system membrane fusion protein